MPVEHMDFNIDIAQGFGMYKNDRESELLDYVSTVNIACGFHAGDPLLIREYLLKCKEKNITINAHIGFNDISGQGYREMGLSPEETEAIVLYQTGAIASFAKAYGLVIDGVRPHGAMYKMASENFDFAVSIMQAVRKFDKWLSFTCLDNEILTNASAETGIVVNREVFADKKYNTDFSLDWNNSAYIPQDEALNRIRTVMFSSQIKIAPATFMPVQCDTLHFDTKNPEIAELLKKGKEIVIPTPSNYNKAQVSGWV